MIGHHKQLKSYYICWCTSIFFLTKIFWNCYWEIIQWHFITIHLTRVIVVDINDVRLETKLCIMKCNKTITELYWVRYALALINNAFKCSIEHHIALNGVIVLYIMMQINQKQSKICWRSNGFSTTIHNQLLRGRSYLTHNGILQTRTVVCIWCVPRYQQTSFAVALYPILRKLGNVSIPRGSFGSPLFYDFRWTILKTK